MRSTKTRRGIAGLAVASAVVSMMSITSAAHATSSVGGQISPSEMMSRAQYWVNNGVPYTESGATAADPEGTQYREDCSGFVSMAWHLNTSLIVTDPAPYDFTNVDGTPNSTYDKGIGAFSNLQQGDAMAYPHQHIFLFDQWTNKSTGDFTYYAESNPTDPTHGPTPANINDATVEGWATSGYVGLRYNNVAPAIPAGFTVAIDADGTGATGQNVSGTVNLTALASAQGYINTLSYTITGPNGYSLPVGGLTGASNYAYSWNTSSLAGGVYTITASANEVDGQIHTYTGTVAVHKGDTSDSTWTVYDPDTKTMMLFGLGAGGHLGLTRSTNGGASWSNWTDANLYWSLEGTPNAVYDADAKKTLLFARGSANGAMGVTASTNGGVSWSNWTTVNPYWSNFSGDASAVYNPDTKRITVFARGGDGKIGYTQSGDAGASWSNWAEVNAFWANFSGDPHAIYDPATKTMTVFAKGAAGTGQIGYTQSTNDGASWSNWAPVNAYWANFTSDPHAVINPDTGTVSLFAKGSTGKIGYTQSTNNGASWSIWAEVNPFWGNFSGAAYPVYNQATKTISLLARGGDGKMGVTTSANDGASWSNWAEANQFWNGFTGDPTAVYNPDTSQATVFALGGGGHMGYSQSVNSVNGWTNWAEVNPFWTLVGN